MQNEELAAQRQEIESAGEPGPLPRVERIRARFPGAAGKFVVNSGICPEFEFRMLI